jgi:uncharacterized membrane protein YobD (UPF0266 family)
MLFSTTQGAKVEIVSDDTWLKPRWFATLLAVLTLASYPQIFFGVQTFVYRDFGFFTYPVAYFQRECFWHGEIPLWNPLNYCGTPFLAQWNTQVLYPPAVFYLIFPLSWSLGVFCVLHLFWGGLGMFFLARHWTQNYFAAAFAGIVFAFNGLSENCLMWVSNLVALMWIPWVVWLVQRAWHEGGKMVVIAALVGTLQMLSGAVEFVLFTWIFLGLRGLAALILGESPRRGFFLRATLIVLLISGLCAAQLLPFFDLLDDSRHQENIFAALWPMPVTGWLNFFVPLFRCHAYEAVFMQNNQFWTSSYYVGVITVALALSAMWRARQITIWLLAALTWLGLFLALGNATPIYPWFCQHFSIIGLIRFPIKFVILPVFALPLLAAYGLAKSQRDTGGAAIRFGKSWSLICLATVALILGIIWWNDRSQTPDEYSSIVLVNGLTRVAFFTAIVAGLFFTKKIPKPKLRRALQLLLLLLVWLDLYRQAPQPRTVSRAVFEPNLQHYWTSTPRLGVARAMIQPSVREQFISAFLPDPTENYISRRFALSLNCNLLDDIPKCDGFFSLELHRCMAVLSHDLSEPMLDFVGASQIIIVQTNNFFWQTRTNFLPLLTGGQKPVFASNETILQMLARTNFNPRTEVYLPLAGKNSLAATNSATVKITPEKFSAQKIEATVVADAPAILVAAQAYYHPWHAYVDGNPTRLWPANYAFQAFEIPAGLHHIKLVYEDRQFYLGAIISLATLAGCLMIFCLEGVKKLSVNGRAKGKAAGSA